MLIVAESTDTRNRQLFFLPAVSVVKVIESELSFCVSVLYMTGVYKHRLKYRNLTCRSHHGVMALFGQNDLKMYFQSRDRNFHINFKGHLLRSFHALFLVAWLADGDSLMCCIVRMGRQIAKRDLHLKMQFSNLHFGKPLENKEILHAWIHHALW